MPNFSLFRLLFGGRSVNGSERNDLLFGSFGKDEISGNGGDDFIFGLFGNDRISGGLGNDLILGGSGRDSVNGGDGEDRLFGGRGKDTVEGGDGDDDLFGGCGNDVVVGNKGDDRMFGGRGRDLLVWNNGDGSDLIDGGRGNDRQQVNFDTDLVNDDLQNDDVAEFSVTDQGIQFARVELNGQSVNGLFQLDIRNTETQETDFGAGDDEAQIVGDVLNEIVLNLDGGEGVDNLDLSRAGAGATVDLKAGALNGIHTVENFENIEGSEFEDILIGDDADNVISGNGGVDSLFGGDGNDVLVANKGNDFVFGGNGDDLIVWNNGDGSDLFIGGQGEDRVQVNFDTDLVNDDLQNKDVAEFSTTPDGVQFARVELNDQAVNGLFQLDIREVETLETNFGDNDDEAQIVDDVLDQIVLDLDGGDGVDELDFSQAASGVTVDLASGALNGIHTIENFEHIEGSEVSDVLIGDDTDNVISGNGGVDSLFGGDGNDVLVANKGNDFAFAGNGDDLIVWNNGDGSDLFIGGQGADRVQVNFNTDLINDDLQNADDVALGFVTGGDTSLERIAVNGQSAVGTFALDIRETETLEVNLGGGDDIVRIDDTLPEGAETDLAQRDLDGGEGFDVAIFAGSILDFNIDFVEDGTAIIRSEAGVANVFTDFERIEFDDQQINLIGVEIDAPIDGLAPIAGTASDSFLFVDDQANAPDASIFDVG